LIAGGETRAGDSPGPRDQSQGTQKRETRNRSE
jgi:hypothetical protein